MVVTITRNPNLTKPQVQKVIHHELKEQFPGNSWWTGIAPENCPGFCPERNALLALPLLNLKTCTRQDVLDYFNNSWTLTELLFRGLKNEDTYIRPPYHALRHPMIFYYGHPAVLFVNKMRLAGLRKDPFNLYLEKVLETGVDEMSWDDMSKNEMSWPKVSEVRDYRKTVYEFIVNFINTCPDLDLAPDKRNFLENSPLWSLWMGMEHEKIHFETSSVLIRELPIELVETPEFWAGVHPSAKRLSEVKPVLGKDYNDAIWKKQSGQKVVVGKARTTESFGWDNEYGERVISTKDFEYSSHQITNGEYFEFVASGAYVNDQYWAPEGLQWRKFRNTKRPTFWCATGPEGSHEYELRTIFEIIPMPWSWPCEVNYHEALAFTEWKKEKDQLNNIPNSKLHYRLLTEAEFISLRENRRDPVLQSTALSSLKTEKEIASFSENFNFVWGSPRPADETLYGNTWHWLMDQFNPLPGFEPHYLYDDFSTPCFDGKHQMILGGSFISCGHEASHWARFHFRPHFYQHSGFRMARTLDGSTDNGATYLSTSKEYIHPKRQNVLDQMNKRNWWKNVEQPLEFSEEELKSLLDLTNKAIIKYERDFPKMSPMGEAHDVLTNGLKSGFKTPYHSQKNLPENPESFEAQLDLIFKDLAPYSQLPGHPGFAAYVAGAGNPISNVAELISRTLNPFSGHYMMAPGLVALENEVIKWFLDLFNYDANKSNGFLTTGSSYATLSALMMARNKKIEGHDFSKVTAYISEDGHHCVAKAWAMLGFKKENLRYVKMKNFAMDSDALAQRIAEDKKNGLNPLMIIATLGSTKTGSVDNLTELSKISKEYGMWLHADGAYGALFMLTEKGKGFFKDISQTDSLAFDPHKALQLPYGTGCLIVKDAEDMLFNYHADDSYMPPVTDGIYDYADITPELSREFRGLRVWLPLKVLGIGPFKLNLEEKLKLTEWLSEELSTMPKLKLHRSPDLTILTFSHRDGDQKTKELLETLNGSNEIFLSSCMINGQLAIRFCLLGHKLHFNRLEKVMEFIRAKV